MRYGHRPPDRVPEAAGGGEGVEVPLGAMAGRHGHDAQVDVDDDRGLGSHRARVRAREHRTTGGGTAPRYRGPVPASRLSGVGGYPDGDVFGRSALRARARACENCVAAGAPTKSPACVLRSERARRASSHVLGRASRPSRPVPLPLTRSSKRGTRSRGPCSRPGSSSGRRRRSSPAAVGAAGEQARARAAPRPRRRRRAQRRTRFGPTTIGEGLVELPMRAEVSRHRNPRRFRRKRGCDESESPLRCG